MFLKNCYYLNSLHKNVTFLQIRGRSYTRSYKRPYTFLQMTGRSYKVRHNILRFPLQIALRFFYYFGSLRVFW